MNANLVVTLIAACSTTLSAAPWPQFRGPSGDGVSTAENVPVTFGEKDALKW